MYRSMNGYIGSEVSNYLYVLQFKADSDGFEPEELEKQSQAVMTTYFESGVSSSLFVFKRTFGVIH